MSTANAHRSRRELLNTLADGLDSGRYDGVLAVADSSDILTLADRMLAGLPTKHPLDATIGPFYDTAGLVSWLEISRQAIHKQIKNRHLLAMKSSDGVVLYPAFQFDTSGQALPNLQNVLELIDPQNTDSWGSALWLVTPATALDGASPAVALRSGSAHAVLALAARINAAESA